DESVGDSISNFFSSLFGADSPEAKNYSNVAADTEGILTVQTDSKEKASQAAEILDRNGAVDVNERANQYQAQSGATAKDKTTTEGDMKIPVIEEELQIGKRAVEQGGVRLRSRIIEKPVEETVRLREEHVVVNRRPVDRAATDSDFSTFKEGDLEITERAEQPVVSKQARVKEEISVGKNVEEREETVSDSVRRTEVEVEKLDKEAKARKAGR
ncbi:MAG: YsnF/AvaK domain-containing protein, partial [Acidobacteria bacterium]|nr:YsnF/AvaK domain-containing protein [Acidobacteriota bacterium]